MPAADPRPLWCALPSQVAHLLRAGLLPPLLALCIAPAAHADQVKPFEVSYTLIYHGFTVGQATLTLVQRDHDTWVYSSKREVRGIAALLAPSPPGQESVMHVSESGVQPLTYRVGLGAPTPKDVKLSFDWTTGRVTGVYENANLDEAVPQGTQDELSIGIALVQTMVNGEEPNQVVLLDGKLPHHYRFVREKEEVLNTKVGKIPTIVYKRTKAEGPEVSRFWFAPSYGFVPMRVEQKEDGGTEFSLVVQSIKR